MSLFLMCPKKILGAKHAMLFTAVYLPTQSVHPDRGLPNTKECHLYRCHRQCITDAKPAISTSSFTSTGTGLSDKSSYCPFVSCRTSGLENTLTFASRPILLATKPCLNCPLYPSPDQPHLLATFMTPHPLGVFLPGVKTQLHCVNQLTAKLLCEFLSFASYATQPNARDLRVCTMDIARVCLCQV